MILFYAFSIDSFRVNLIAKNRYGSEDRLPRHVPAIPARPETYSYIIFHGKDIAELTVLDDPSGVQSDPAILDAEIASTEVASGNPPGLGSADKSRGQQLPYGARPTANARNMPAAAHGSYSDAPRGGGKAGGILSHPQPLAKGSSFDGGKGKGKGKGGNDVYFGKGGGMAKGGQEKGKAKGKGYDSYGKAGGQMYMGKGGYDNYGKGKGGDFSKGKGKSDGNSWYYNRNPNQNRANRPVAGVNMPNAKKDDEYVKDLEFVHVFKFYFFLVSTRNNYFNFEIIISCRTYF